MSDVIPFVDLRAQHDEIRSEIDSAIENIINRSTFIGGELVSEFENEFADYLGVNEAIGVANGTDALWLGMLAAGLGNGDAVITTPNTFIATVEAITRTGAYPIFVDIDIATALIDLTKLEEFLETECYTDNDGSPIHTKSGKRVAGIIPVHLYGLPVDIKPLLSLAEEFNLLIIEDACQAHGAEYRVDGEWKRAGSLGITAGFSFYPAKNLGALGDGGAVVTNDHELALKMRWLHDHGSSDKFIHQSANGWNSRLDAIQAAVLSLKLKVLDEWNARRRMIAARYQEMLEELPLALPVEYDNVRHVYHLYVVRVEDRDCLQEELSARAIQTGLHYPIPLHLQKAYQYLGYPPGSFPNSEKSASSILSLPMHPFLTFEQVDRVAAACSEILSK